MQTIRVAMFISVGVLSLLVGGIIGQYTAEPGKGWM